MINLNDRSAMENYYLLKKLPDYSHIKETGKDILKDTKYYNSKLKDNQWNNKFRFTNKYSTFFHDANETEGLDKRLNLEQQEKKKEEDQQNQYKAYVNYMRNEALDRLHERKMERINTQLDSQQQIYNINEKNMRDLATQDGSIKQKRMMRKSQVGIHHLTGRAPTLWNELNQTSSKHMGLSFNERIIEKDSVAAETIAKRIERDEQDEALRNSIVKTNMDKIRSTFKEKSIKNFEFQQKILQNRTSPPPNPASRSVLEIHRVRSKSYINPELAEKQKEEALRKKQYEEFLKQERDYLQSLNSQYEVDKKKYNLQQSIKQPNTTTSPIMGKSMQTVSPYSSNHQFNEQYNQSNKLLTFGGAAAHTSQNFDINNSMQFMDQKISNMFNSQSQIENNENNQSFDVNGSIIAFDQKSPILKKQHYQTSNSQNFNQSNFSLSNELAQRKKFQQSQSLFGNTSISQILEKPFNLNEIKNTADLLEEIQEQQLQESQLLKKATPLKSSLKCRSYSQNTQDNLAAFNKDQQLTNENPYNPTNEVQLSEASRSKEIRHHTNNSDNQGQNESQLNVTSKKVNFNKENSFVEYQSVPSQLDGENHIKNHTLQNKDSFSVNEQDFSIDQKHFSRNGINQNRYCNSASLTTSNFPLKYIKTPIIHKQNDHLNSLSQPKTEKVPPKYTDKSDFRGLLSGEVDRIESKLDNSFVKTMTTQSKIVKDQSFYSADFRSTSQTKKRFGSTSKQQSTMISDFDQSSNIKSTTSYYTVAKEPSSQAYVEDFDKFDEQYTTNEVRRCFPGKSLNEYRLTVREFQKQKEKDRALVIKKKVTPSLTPQENLNESKLHSSFLQIQQSNSRILQ